MLDLFLPNKQINSVFSLTSEVLKENIIKGVIVDLDNTLVPWNVASPTEEIMAWLSDLKSKGIQVVVFSNNNTMRVNKFIENTDIIAIPNAKKPLSRQFKKIQKMMKLSEGEIAVVGDQLLTDIFGGNRVGFYTILVNPIVQSDAFVTTFNRLIEKLILNYFYRKGKLVRGHINE